MLGLQPIIMGCYGLYSLTRKIFWTKGGSCTFQLNSKTHHLK